MRAVVGLGNPGEAYAGTRHNAGFMLVQKMAEAWGVSLRGRKFRSRTAQAEVSGARILLALPQTYMNQSGLAVRDIVRGLGIGPEDLVVVYDDLDISLGEIRVRKQGRPGTHKGLGSVVRELGTTLFPRIRIGIGPLPGSCEATDYVLSPFSPSEKPLLRESLERGGEALAFILAGDIPTAMSLFNRSKTSL